MDNKQKILISFCILILFSMLLFILFSDKGLSDLFKLKSERDRLMNQNVQLKKENDTLYRTIERLRNDPEYIESVARKELGMIKKDEVILKPKNNKDGSE
ncbi:MAG: septum formation initiator family protein [Deltaproteobacteria bacterium]